MTGGSDRIDGWKAIDNHFCRDRSTVIRWAHQRHLPTHAIPGGKTRTVYAFRSELDAWAKQAGMETSDLGPDSTRPHAAEGTRRNAGSWRRNAIGVLLAAGVIAASAAMLSGGDTDPRREPRAATRAAPPPATLLPADPTARRLFIKGRDDWALRTRASLAASIAELGRVTELSPNFAPAFADLADTFLIEQESGSMSTNDAFERAERAAEHALQLDPNSAAANRALGFIAYWRQDDPLVAGRLFARAIRLDPADPQTHFWFANILADNGQDAAAMQEFAAARLRDPGSTQIAADLAWADWSAGRDRLARAELTALIARQPDNVEAHDCLGIMDLAAGDAAGYLHETDIRARLRGRSDLIARATALARANRRGGIAAMLAFLLKQERADQTTAVFPDHTTAAFLASLLGERPTLIDILTEADRLHERWGSAGYVRRIAHRWRDDGQVTTLLARRKPPAIPYGVLV